MALEPVGIHLPFEIPASDSVGFTLESYITGATWVLYPKLLFWNTSAKDLDLRVQFKLDFGVSGNPLEAGTFTDDLFPNATISSGDRQPIDLQEDVASIVTPSSDYPVSHIVTVTNNDAVDDLICRFLLTGFFDETLKHEGINKFIRIQ